MPTNTCSTGWIDQGAVTAFSAVQYGADPSGNLESSASINAALTAASVNGGSVFLPPGTYLINSKLTIPAEVSLVGSGRNATIIKATSSFPASTPLIQLGAQTGLAFGCRVENLRINCNSISGSIGIYSTDINEESGARRVLVTGYMDKGIQIAESGALVPDHFIFDDVETTAAATATGTYGFHINYSRNGGQLRRITVNSDNTGTTQTAGVYVAGTVAGGASVHIFGCNVERHDDGVFFDTNAGGTVINPSLFTNGTSCVRINSSHPVTVLNALRSVGTNLIRNDRLGQNMTLLRTGFYFAGFDTAGNQAFAMGGTTANSGNIISDVHPVFQIRSMGTAADASRASLDMVNGNGAGWRINFEGNGGRPPLEFKPISSNTPGTALAYLDNTGSWALTDGISTPPTVAGYMQLYAPTASGDLTVLYGDGVTKTLCVDATGAGTFTATAAATTTISDARVLSSSVVTVTPSNAAAGLLLRTKTYNVQNLVAGTSFDFVVSATGAGAPAGTETFYYQLYPS